MEKSNDLPVAPPSESAREGTAAHEMASAVLFGVVKNPSDWIGRQTSNGVFATAEMADFVKQYVDAVHALTVTEYHVEYQTDFALVLLETDGVQVNGRADAITWNAATGVLTIEDFKYGFRLVEPDDNWTLIAHAIGYVMRHQLRPTRVIFTIHQPRPYHPDGPKRSAEISGDQLAEYHLELREFFRQRANTLNTGPHCRDCSARATCPAAMEAGINAIDVSHSVAVRDDISNDVLSVLLDDLDRAAESLELLRDALGEMAKHRLANGAIIPNRMLETGYGNRRWNDTITAGLISTLSGVQLDKLTEVKTLSPAQAKKAGVSDQIIAVLSTRPTTGVKMVRRNLNKLAAKAFGGN